MGSPILIASICKGKSIRIQRVKTNMAVGLPAYMLSGIKITKELALFKNLFVQKIIYVYRRKYNVNMIC